MKDMCGTYYCSPVYISKELTAVLKCGRMKTEGEKEMDGNRWSLIKVEL